MSDRIKSDRIKPDRVTQSLQSTFLSEQDDGRVYFRFSDSVRHWFKQYPVPWETPRMDEIIRQARTDMIYPGIISCQARLTCNALDYVEHTSPVLYALYYWMGTRVITEDQYNAEYERLAALIQLCNERLCKQKDPEPANDEEIEECD